MGDVKYLRRVEVEALTGLSRSSIYRLRAEGKFIPPHRLGKNAVRWNRAELLEWINSRRLGS
jgi:prophage regulatory protein